MYTSSKNTNGPTTENHCCACLVKAERSVLVAQGLRWFPTEDIKQRMMVDGTSKNPGQLEREWVK